jgi:hypothetical protein
VWVPDARLWHLESASRDPGVTLAERAMLTLRWKDDLEADPYYTPSTADLGGFKRVAWR